MIKFETVGNIVGHGLIEAFTAEQINAVEDNLVYLFGGNHFEEDDKNDKYSETTIIVNVNGEEFTIYMSFGIYRIGGRKRSANFEELKAALLS